MPTFERGRLLLRKPIASDAKPRLVIVVSRQELNQGSTITVVPVTSQQLEKRTKTDYCVFLPAGCAGNDKDCVAKCDAVGPIDKTLVESNVGVIPDKRMREIDEALKWVLKLS